MKFSTSLYTIFIVIISSCQSKNDKNIDDHEPDTVAGNHKEVKSVPLDLESPVALDSSDYVMYPLPNKLNRDDDGGSFGSSSRTPSFWNIIFYNTVTKKYHLLDEKRKMVINSYNTAYSNSEYYSAAQTVDQLSLKTIQDGNYIFYSVKTKDLNNDGELDKEDTDYLFISDKEGNNFKQISPDNADVKSWKIIKKTGKLLMLTVKDDAKNQKIAVPYTYDLKKGGAPEKVFSADFIESVHQLNKKLWPPKKQ